jgi:ribonuclease BN (tRNA processing enzyme)
VDHLSVEKETDDRIGRFKKMTAAVVTILGSGTCVPSLERSACAVLMEINKTKLLFDSGPGTMKRLLEASVSIFDISYIFYSHFHPDHTGEMVPLLFATKYPNSRQRKKALSIMAGSGFLSFFEGLKAVYGEWIDLPKGMLQLSEFSSTVYDSRRFDHFLVETRPMNHRPESIGYRVTDAEGRTMVYSGDTDNTENLVSLAANADLLVCESAMPDELKTPGHLTPSLAGKIASHAGVKNLVLTHLYPECDQADIESQCRQTYGGPLIIGEDLLRIQL